MPKGDELCYRNKATLEISTGGNRLKKGGTIENLEEVKIGFKARGTHKVVHCDKCYIQHPVVSAVIKATKNFMDEDNISAWDEKWAQGLMRHMIVRVSESSKEVMVIFIINGKGIPNGEKLISIMDEAVYAEGYFLESVCVSTKKDKVKNGEIYGKKVEVYAGKPVIHDEMMGMNFEVSPRSFYQVNPKMTEKLYSKVKELVGATENDVILDLYCGVGSIGICCATSAKYILGIERVHDAIVDANRNAVINNLINIRFLEGKAEEVLPMLAAGYGDLDLVKLVQNANTVILDPPRAGCEKSLIDSVLKVSPEKIVYVSCDPATLARDLKIFAENGYELVEVSLFDMFPWSVHVETVALLSKLNVDKHIDVEIKLDELDLTSAESKATYAQIKEYVWNKFGLKVPTLYIAQIKKKCGIKLREHYNKSKKEKQVIPQCTPEKEEAIMDALRHFKMI